MNQPLDCIVIGGGAAGLSAALMLGRARRSTLVIDGGRQSNLPAHAIGGLLAQEGTSPAQLYATAHAQLAGYPSVEIRGATVARVEAIGAAGAERFAVELDGGGRETAKRIVVATGTDYVAPELPGLAELWGRSAFHCPFCHGWEVRDRPLALLAGGEHAPVHAQLLRNWSDDLVLLTDGPAGLGEHGAAELAAAGIRVDERPVAELLHAAGADGTPTLRAIRFADGGELAREGILVATAMQPRTALAAQLGVQLDTRGAIVADAYQRTSLDGVFAAGDAGGGMQVAAAYGSGSAAGAWATQSLIAADNGRAFEPPPLPQPAP